MKNRENCNGTIAYTKKFELQLNHGITLCLHLKEAQEGFLQLIYALGQFKRKI